MKKLSDTRIIEYRYDTEKERSNHVEMMELIGYKCDGQVKKTDSLEFGREPEYYWFARFYEYGKIN